MRPLLLLCVLISYCHGFLAPLGGGSTSVLLGKVRGYINITRGAKGGAGGEKTGEQSQPSFTQWREYFLENDMGNPTKATYTEKMMNSKVDWSTDRVLTETEERSPSVPQLLEDVKTTLDNRGLNDVEAVLKAGKLLHSLDKDPSIPSKYIYDRGLLSALVGLTTMRIATDGNGLKFDGTSDTPENKDIWQSATSVMDLILGYADLKFPSGRTDEEPLAHQIFTEALMYSMSSKGVVLAAASGDAFAYKKAAKVFLEKYPDFDGGVGNIFMGAYLMAAPWPIRNTRQAAKYFDQALAVAPNSKRNNYYAGLAALANRQWAEAEKFFLRSLECDCGSVTEQDIEKFLTTEASRALEEARKNMQQK